MMVTLRRSSKKPDYQYELLWVIPVFRLLIVGGSRHSNIRMALGQAITLVTSPLCKLRHAAAKLLFNHNH